MDENKEKRLESCLAQCDPLSKSIVENLREGRSYEYICEALFISRSTLNYRLKKIYAAAEVSGRKEFEALLSKP